MSKKDIYGPDLDEHEAEGASIAKTGLKCMKSDQKTSEAEKSTGKDASRSELDSEL